VVARNDTIGLLVLGLKLMNKFILYTHFITPTTLRLIWNGLNGHLKKKKKITSIQLMPHYLCEVNVIK
jgi:hypothetical protein